jgi:primosomal protein N' (replication factor Y)
MPGRVIIQTYKPDDPVIGFAARQDYRAFFESEFRRRRNGLYPPFTNLARVLIESASEETADRAARETDLAVRKLLAEHPAWQRKVLNIVSEPPSVQFLRGKHRRQVLMKTLVSPETDAFFSALTELTAEERDGAEIYLEINPTTMI